MEKPFAAAIARLQGKEERKEYDIHLRMKGLFINHGFAQASVCKIALVLLSPFLSVDLVSHTIRCGGKIIEQKDYVPSAAEASRLMKYPSDYPLPPNLAEAIERARGVAKMNDTSATK